MRRECLVAIIVVVALGIADGALAKKQTVYLKNGQKLTGEVTKTEDGYEIKLVGGTVIIPAKRVLRIEEAVTPKKELERRLAKADPKDAQALYRVGAWARENKLLKDSRDLLKKVLKLQPKHENAKLLLRLVEIELAGAAKRTDPDKGQPKTGNDDKKVTIDPSMFLTKEDIYRIRLAELKDNERVSIEYRNNVLNRFVDLMKGQDMFARRGGEKRFRGWNRNKQVTYIRKHADVREHPGIHDDILVKTNPRVIKVFRSRIWPVILKGCASPSCHGGAKGSGKLKLFDMPVTDDRVLYTNFHILNAWEHRGQKLIVRDHPKHSMILQAGLPKDIAKQNLKHPKPIVPPVFSSEKDANFVAIEKWIRSLELLLPPGHRVKYTLPGLGAGKPAKPAPAK